MSAPGLRILLWRGWDAGYGYPATFECLDRHSIGGTCAQLLWHAANLVQLEHSVQVLGASKEDRVEEGVDFVGASDRDGQVRAVASGRIQTPDVIFMEGSFQGADYFRAQFPRARLVHVGQNLEIRGPTPALAKAAAVDAYACVSPGQLAHFCCHRPDLWHKFHLVRNAVPWRRLFSRLSPLPVEDRVAWVGGWGKRGLREWARTMQDVLARYPSYRWDLFGPHYGHGAGPFPEFLLRGIMLPRDRLSIRSLPLGELAREISRARVVLVSLGGETACISALDAHAMGRPVLSGNDIVFRFVNPEGTGVRVTRASERMAAITRLLDDHELSNRLGTDGQEFVRQEFSEDAQKADLAKLLRTLTSMSALGPLASIRAPSRLERARVDWMQRTSRRVLKIASFKFERG